MPIKTLAVYTLENFLPSQSIVIRRVHIKLITDKSFKETSFFVDIPTRYKFQHICWAYSRCLLLLILNHTV